MPQVYGFFFKLIVQSVLLFGAETWEVTPRMGRVLGDFQNQVARRLIGRILWRRLDGKWKYTSSEAARVDVWFKMMDTYIRRNQNTFAQHIDTQ